MTLEDARRAAERVLSQPMTLDGPRAVRRQARSGSRRRDPRRRHRRRRPDGREVCRAVAEEPRPRRWSRRSTARTWARRSARSSGDPELDVRVADELDALLERRAPRSPSTSPTPTSSWTTCGGASITRSTSSWGRPASPPSDLDEIRARDRRDASESNVFVAPNFAIGAVLMLRFAARGRPVLPGRRDDRAASRRQGRRALAARRSRPSDGSAGRAVEAVAPDRRDESLPGVARRRRRRHPGALGAAARASSRIRRSSSAAGADPHDPPRLHGPGLVHARAS